MNRAALLVLADGRFPAGGHAHSGGAEAAVTARRVRDAASLQEFCRGRLHTSGLVAAGLAAAAAAGYDPLLLDEAADARTPSPALRAAPQARPTMMRAARAAWPSPELDALATARPQRRAPAHRPGPGRPLGRPDAAGRRLRGCLRERQLPGHRHRPPAQPRPLRRHRHPGPPRRRHRPLAQRAAEAAAARPGRGRAGVARRLGASCSTSPPNSTPPARCACSPPDHLTSPTVRLPRPEQPCTCTTATPRRAHPQPRRSAPAPTAAVAPCASDWAGRSAPARPPPSPPCAAHCATNCPSRWSPTTSTPARTPSSCCAKPSCPRAHQGGRDRRLPAHRHPRRHLRQPRSRRGPGGQLGPLDLVLVESGGDNLTATFSRGLVDAQIFVIDVAGGDDIPRKGGPGVTAADLLVINKTDLAPYVGADLEGMARDAKTQRGDLPVAFTTLKTEGGVTPVSDWVRARLAAWTASAA